MTMLVLLNDKSTFFLQNGSSANGCIGFLPPPPSIKRRNLVTAFFDEIILLRKKNVSVNLPAPILSMM